MSRCSECVELLRRMVAIPTGNENEEELALFIADLMMDMGMNVNIQRLGAKRCNVVGRLESGCGSRKLLLLGGHLDTVSPSEQWKTDPYRLVRDGDRLYGLGSGDMKGGLAAQLFVIKSLIADGVKLDADIEFAAVADEERYSLGAYEYVSCASALREYEDAFFILAEPHFDNIVVGATGKVMLKCAVTGVSGHAAEPEKGINAIDCMAEFLTALNREYGSLYAKGKVGSHCCLRIDSDWKGYSLNIPERCECSINKQLLTDEDLDETIDRMSLIYEENVGKGRIDITKDIPCYPSYKLPENQKTLSALLDILKKNGREPELRINQSVSDGNVIYPKLGIPGILYGPVGVNFHRAGEYTTEGSLRRYMNELYAFIKTYYGAR